MKIWVHYDRSDGAIAGWENTDKPYAVDGCETVAVDMDSEPDPKRQKMDIVLLALVDMTDAEIAAADAPTAVEVRGAIAGELLDTDRYVGVADYPQAERKQQVWRSYRQALRDLSKPQDDRETLLSPVEIMKAWPSRPDGADPIAHLRSRVRD